MRILLDANLSLRLIKKISPIFLNCLHVERTGLPFPAEDAQIWAWAKAQEYMIVTNDEDFTTWLPYTAFRRRSFCCAWATNPLAPS